MYIAIDKTGCYGKVFITSGNTKDSIIHSLEFGCKLPKHRINDILVIYVDSHSNAVRLYEVAIVSYGFGDLIRLYEILVGHKHCKDCIYYNHKGFNQFLWLGRCHCGLPVTRDIERKYNHDGSEKPGVTEADICGCYDKGSRQLDN